MTDLKYTPDMAGSGQYGICAHCNLPPTKEGHDGCLGTLHEKEVMNACCGHGSDQQAYIQTWDGKCIRGAAAIAAIKAWKIANTHPASNSRRR